MQGVHDYIKKLLFFSQEVIKLKFAKAPVEQKIIFLSFFLIKILFEFHSEIQNISVKGTYNLSKGDSSIVLKSIDLDCTTMKVI
jgi:hypothetical protein